MEPEGNLFNLPLHPQAAKIQIDLAPELSAQFKTAPTGNERVTLSLVPT